MSGGVIANSYYLASLIEILLIHGPTIAGSVSGLAAIGVGSAVAAPVLGAIGLVGVTSGIIYTTITLYKHHKHSNTKFKIKDELEILRKLGESMMLLEEMQKTPENINKQTLKQYKELISNKNFQNYMHILLDTLKQDANNKLGNPKMIEEMNNKISAIENEIKSNGFLGKNLDENKKTLLGIITQYEHKKKEVFTAIQKEYDDQIKARKALVKNTEETAKNTSTIASNTAQTNNTLSNIADKLDEANNRSDAILNELVAMRTRITENLEPSNNSNNLLNDVNQQIDLISFEDNTEKKATKDNNNNKTATALQIGFNKQADSVHYKKNTNSSTNSSSANTFNNQSKNQTLKQAFPVISMNKPLNPNSALKASILPMKPQQKNMNIPDNQIKFDGNTVRYNSQDNDGDLSLIKPNDSASNITGHYSIFSAASTVVINKLEREKQELKERNRQLLEKVEELSQASASQFNGSDGASSRSIGSSGISHDESNTSLDYESYDDEKLRTYSDTSQDLHQNQVKEFANPNNKLFQYQALSNNPINNKRPSQEFKINQNSYNGIQSNGRFTTGTQ